MTPLYIFWTLFCFLQLYGSSVTLDQKESRTERMNKFKPSQCADEVVRPKGHEVAATSSHTPEQDALPYTPWCSGNTSGYQQCRLVKSEPTALDYCRYTVLKVITGNYGSRLFRYPPACLMVPTRPQTRKGSTLTGRGAWRSANLVVKSSESHIDYRTASFFRPDGIHRCDVGFDHYLDVIRDFIRGGISAGWGSGPI